MSFGEFYSEFRDAVKMTQEQRLRKYRSEMDIDAARAKARRTYKMEMAAATVLGLSAAAVVYFAGHP